MLFIISFFSISRFPYVIKDDIVKDFKAIIYVWGGSNYASLASSFWCIVNKITYEATEAEIYKNFVNFTGKHLCQSLF